MTLLYPRNSYCTNPKKTNLIYRYDFYTHITFLFPGISIEQVMSPTTATAAGVVSASRLQQAGWEASENFDWVAGFSGSFHDMVAKKCYD